MTDQKVVEEILEFIWTQREKGKDSIAELLKIYEVKEAKGDTAKLEEMEKDGVVHIKGSSIMLTANGDRLADAIVYCKGGFTNFYHKRWLFLMESYSTPRNNTKGTEPVQSGMGTGYNKNYPPGLPNFHVF